MKLWAKCSWLFSVKKIFAESTAVKEKVYFSNKGVMFLYMHVLSGAKKQFPKTEDLDYLGKKQECDQSLLFKSYLLYKAVKTMIQ